MKKLVVLIIAVLTGIACYTAYAIAMPQAITGSKVVYVNDNASNYNNNSDADENLPDGLKPLSLPTVYGDTQVSQKEFTIPASVQPYVGKWVVEKQIGVNPYPVKGPSPIGKTITISQSEFIDNSKNSAIDLKNPYYTLMTIPYDLLTQDYDVNFYDQTGLPKKPLSIIIVNPSNSDVPLQDPAFNTDALFIDNGNLVVVNGLSFFLCKKVSN